MGASPLLQKLWPHLGTTSHCTESPMESPHPQALSDALGGSCGSEAARPRPAGGSPPPHWAPGSPSCPCPSYNTLICLAQPCLYPQPMSSSTHPADLSLQAPQG